MTKSYYLSASIICSNFESITKDIQQLTIGEVDFIHFDVMDGIFVPRFGLLPELLSAITKLTTIPVQVHLMVLDPYKYIDTFIDAGAKTIILHYNSKHIYESILLLKERKINIGMAINLETELTVLNNFLPSLNSITLMAIQPGVLNQSTDPNIYNKIQKCRFILQNYPEIKIEIDGGVTLDTAPKLIKSGAHGLVCGSSTIFKHPYSIVNKVNELKILLNSN